MHEHPAVGQRETARGRARSSCHRSKTGRAPDFSAESSGGPAGFGVARDIVCQVLLTGLFGPRGPEWLLPEIAITEPLLSRASVGYQRPFRHVRELGPGLARRVEQVRPLDVVVAVPSRYPEPAVIEKGVARAESMRFASCP